MQQHSESVPDSSGNFVVRHAITCMRGIWADDRSCFLPRPVAAHKDIIRSRFHLPAGRILHPAALRNDV